MQFIYALYMQAKLIISSN